VLGRFSGMPDTSRSMKTVCLRPGWTWSQRTQEHIVVQRRHLVFGRFDEESSCRSCSLPGILPARSLNSE
jgi:hypothetical protein